MDVAQQLVQRQMAKGVLQGRLLLIRRGLRRRFRRSGGFLRLGLRRRLGGGAVGDRLRFRRGRLGLRCFRLGRRFRFLSGLRCLGFLRGSRLLGGFLGGLRFRRGALDGGFGLLGGGVVRCRLGGGFGRRGLCLGNIGQQAQLFCRGCR